MNDPSTHNSTCANLPDGGSLLHEQPTWNGSRNHDSPETIWETKGFQILGKICFQLLYDIDCIVNSYNLCYNMIPYYGLKHRELITYLHYYWGAVLDVIRLEWVWQEYCCEHDWWLKLEVQLSRRQPWKFQKAWINILLFGSKWPVKENPWNHSKYLIFLKKRTRLSTLGTEDTITTTAASNKHNPMKPQASLRYMNKIA